MGEKGSARVGCTCQDGLKLGLTFQTVRSSHDRGYELMRRSVLEIILKMKMKRMRYERIQIDVSGYRIDTLVQG